MLYQTHDDPGTATTTPRFYDRQRTRARRGSRPRPPPARRADPQPELTIAIYYKYLGRDAS